MGFWDRILSFIGGLFGAAAPTTQNTPTPTPTLTAAQRKNLGLETFRPTKSVTTGKDADNCTFIKFSF
jgi:hypothetical protein